MGFSPGFVLAVPLAYAVVFALVAVLAYLVLRFAIRDGLRGHTVWLERRSTAPRPDDAGDHDH